MEFWTGTGHAAVMTRHATTPEDLPVLFVQRANARDVAGLAALREPGAVLAFPPGRTTVGRDAIHAVFAAMPAEDPPPPLAVEGPLPTLRAGDLALTATRSADGRGVRAQVARRQPDGSWLRLLDRPEADG